MREEHAHPVECGKSDESGTADESQRARGTHVLSSANERISSERACEPVSEGTHSLLSADGGINRCKNIKSASQWHSLTVEGKRRGKSERPKKAREGGALTSCRVHTTGQVRMAKKATEKGELTLCRAQREG